MSDNHGRVRDSVINLDLVWTDEDWSNVKMPTLNSTNETAVPFIPRQPSHEDIELVYISSHDVDTLEAYIVRLSSVLGIGFIYTVKHKHGIYSDIFIITSNLDSLNKLINQFEVEVRHDPLRTIKDERKIRGSEEAIKRRYKDFLDNAVATLYISSEASHCYRGITRTYGCTATLDRAFLLYAIQVFLFCPNVLH